ncbi:MAG TPA: hypothetical protein VL356_13830 [Acidocella sp.]|jgi:hypothetical protein|nr:hypothetical protein [Acidocella sp.]
MKPVQCAALCGALLLSACATAYQPIGTDATGGYMDDRLAKNLYTVTFAANGFTGQHYAYNMAMLRAADLGQSLNYPWMAIEGEASVARNPQVPAYQLKVAYFEDKPDTHEGQVFNTATEAQTLRKRYGIP